MVNEKHIGDIEDRFRAAGYSLRGFCEYAGIAASTWTRWKAGKNLPNMATWERINEALERLEEAA